MDRLILWTDGGARGNPGPAGIGVVMTDAQGEVVAEIAEYIGEATNNQAEYRALIAGLTRARELAATVVDIRMDSELVVRQLNGEYKVKNENMKPLYVQATALLKTFARYTIQHVRREQNAEADKLVNQALDAAVL